MKKLAIVTSHPIQYNAPLFQLLAARNKIQIRVFYTWGQTKDGEVYDPDFKKSFRWDLPLTNGYDAVFLENSSANAGAGHFNGIKNKDLISSVKNYQPDAILLYGWSFHSHLQLLRYFKGKVQLLFRGDSTLLDEPGGFSLRKTARRFFLKWIYHKVDYCLYTGEDNKQYFLKHGVPPAALVYAPHAVHNERFFDDAGLQDKAASEWRLQLGIPPQALVFLFAGKLEPKKDPLLLIQCFRQLKDSDVRLVIVGNGVLEEKARQMADGDPRILFLDFQNQQQMPVVYRLCDIFVLPSKGPGETWGLSVNEAMACAKPVLVSNKCGCAKDLVKTNGKIFEAGNAAALQAAMEWFLLSKEQLPFMGIESQQMIEHFSTTAVAEAIEAII